MTAFDVLTWSLAIVTVYGAYLNARQERLGFIVWGLANIVWILIDASRGIYAQCALYLVFIAFNIYGWMKWKETEKEGN